MMILKTMFQRADVKDFLYEILTDDRFINIKSDYYPKKEYALMIAYEAFIDYAILFDDIELIDEYLIQIRRFMKKFDNYEDIKNGMYKVIGKLAAVKLELEDLDLTEEEYNKRIITYIYDRYIINGYMFNAYPSLYENEVISSGLDPYNFKCNMTRLTNMKTILEKHGLTLNVDLEDQDYVGLTNNIQKTCYMALESPYYLSQMTSITSYKEGSVKDNDRAFFENDFKKAFKNLEQLCRDMNFTNSEATILMECFVSEWKNLRVTSSYPTIAFVKKKAVNKDYLKDYRNIIAMCGKEDVDYLIGRILNSKEEVLKRYTPIKKEDVISIKLPSYRQIMYEVVDYQEEFLENELDIEKMPERVNVRMEVANAYGSASILALAGVFLITLGVMVAIMVGM